MDSQVDRMKALRMGDKVVGIALLVALISSFLPWYGFSAPGFGSGSVSGFHGWGFAYVFFWLATTGLFVARVFGSGSMKIPDLPVPDWQVFIAGGALMLLSALVFACPQYADVPSGSGLGYSDGVSFGWFLALLAAVAVGVGGYLKRSETSA